MSYSEYSDKSSIEAQASDIKYFHPSRSRIAMLALSERAEQAQWTPQEQQSYEEWKTEKRRIAAEVERKFSWFDLQLQSMAQRIAHWREENKSWFAAHPNAPRSRISTRRTYY